MTTTEQSDLCEIFGEANNWQAFNNQQLKQHAESLAKFSAKEILDYMQYERNESVDITFGPHVNVSKTGLPNWGDVHEQPFMLYDDSNNICGGLFRYKQATFYINIYQTPHINHINDKGAGWYTVIDQYDNARLIDISQSIISKWSNHSRAKPVLDKLKKAIENDTLDFNVM